MAISQIRKEMLMQKTEKNGKKPVEECKSMLVLSLGTGAAKYEEKYNAAKASKWGLISWMYDNGATPLLDIYFDASSDMVDFHVSTLFQAYESKNNYLRIQVRAYSDSFYISSLLVWRLEVILNEWGPKVYKLMMNFMFLINIHIYMIIGWQLDWRCIIPWSCNLREYAEAGGDWEGAIEEANVKSEFGYWKVWGNQGRGYKWRSTCLLRQAACGGEETQAKPMKLSHLYLYNVVLVDLQREPFNIHPRLLLSFSFSFLVMISSSFTFAWILTKHLNKASSYFSHFIAQMRKPLTSKIFPFQSHIFPIHSRVVTTRTTTWHRNGKGGKEVGIQFLPIKMKKDTESIAIKLGIETQTKWPRRITFSLPNYHDSSIKTDHKMDQRWTIWTYKDLHI